MLCFRENFSNLGNSVLSTAVVREAFSSNLEHFVPDWPGFDNLLHLLWNINLRIAKWNSENSVGRHLEPSWWQPKPNETIMFYLNRDPSLLVSYLMLTKSKTTLSAEQSLTFSEENLLPLDFHNRSQSMPNLGTLPFTFQRELLRKSIAKDVWSGKTWS